MMHSLITTALTTAFLLSTASARSPIFVEQPVPEKEAPGSLVVEPPTEYANTDLTDDNPGVVPTGSPCTCDERYFKHYKIKECAPVYKEGCHCPVRFNCPDDFMTRPDVCYYDGHVYQNGDAIKTTNPCEICSCRLSYYSNTSEIDCIHSECPSVFRPVNLPEGCYEIYDKNSCCSVGTSCDNENDTNNSTAKERLCVLDGKTYHFGQKMYPKSDPCLSCFCNENYTGVGGSTCSTYKCGMEKDRPQLKRGCLPIYHEATCCPIEYHCYEGNEEIIPAANPSPLSAETDENKCVFNGQKYNIGDILDIKHPTHCVTCTCATPPDFTCVHKRCPGPPNDDYDNCRASYTPGQCCSTYDCSPQAPIHFSPRAPCSPVNCGETCSEVSVPNGCPMCLCGDIACSVPFCSENCQLVTDVEPGTCPYCNCSDEMPLGGVQCAPVKCSPQCHEAFNEAGCPMCLCGPLCSPPKCEVGCELQTDLEDGECPGCACSSNSSIDSVNAIQCGMVKCPSMCKEVTGDHGCPACQCDPLCSPPKCDPGCRIESVPSSGPCPGCVCDSVYPGEIHCDMIKCDEHCKEVLVPNGCSMCQCDEILCSPPLCPEGCEIETEFALGTCPGCKCPTTIPIDKPICAPVKCSPQCYEAISPQGCPMCMCGPLCSPPKCDEGCHVQHDVPEGQCPGCVCPTTNTDKIGEKIQCSPVKCPPLCKEAIGDHGCLTCVCEPMCSPPKCDRGCHLESVPSKGPCPGCVCPPGAGGEVPGGIICEPVYCPPGCEKGVGDHGCETCACEPVCDIPFCDPGCHIDTSENSGPCPGCVCDGEDDVNKGENLKCPELYCQLPCVQVTMAPGTCPVCQCQSEPPLPMLAKQVACSPPRCDPGCRAQLQAGYPCPTCVCPNRNRQTIPQRVLCSPPRCNPGCRTQLLPGSTCPSCVCPNRNRQQIPQQVACSPPRCDPGCRTELLPGDVCPGCVCDNKDLPTLPHQVACSPPRCDPGCRVELLPGDACPGCVCDNINLQQCSPPRCDPGCRVELLPGNTCPSCVCDNVNLQQCSPPRCDPGCRVGLIPPSTCPQCICPNKQTRSAGCPPARYCGPRCRRAVDRYGCDTCLCDPLCSVPRCRPGCYIDPNPSGPCPGCVCSK